MKNEFDIMRLLLHPHIVRAYEAYMDNNVCYLVMEYCPTGDLFDRILSKIKFNETEIRIMIGQIMDAVHYMHIIGIIHRDIKPENILYYAKSDSFIVRLTDFGASKTFFNNIEENNQFHSFIASKYYVAPEVLEENPCYNKEVDCWSVGIIAYILLIGYAPFNGKTPLDVYKKIRKDPVKYYSKEWKKYSDESLHFIKRLLVKNPIKRMTSKEAVQHAWLKGPDLHTFSFNEAVINTIPKISYSNISYDSMTKLSEIFEIEKTLLKSMITFTDTGNLEKENEK